jgi:hypothetical protein
MHLVMNLNNEVCISELFSHWFRWVAIAWMQHNGRQLGQCESEDQIIKEIADWIALVEIGCYCIEVI